MVLFEISFSTLEVISKIIFKNYEYELKEIVIKSNITNQAFHKGPCPSLYPEIIQAAA